MPKQIARDVVGEFLETGKQTAKAVRQVVTGPPRSVKPRKQQKQEVEEIKKMAQLDKRRSGQAYKDIQAKVKLLGKQRVSQGRKYETGKPGFDEEQVKDPESFMGKLEKQRDEAEKKQKRLPWTAKRGMGTGEIRRGVSG